MDRLFQDAKDLNVSAVIAYGKAEDSKLYVDEDLTIEANANLVADAFKRNVLVIVVGDVVYKPVKLDDNAVTVIDVASGTVTATTFTAASE